MERKRPVWRGYNGRRTILRPILAVLAATILAPAEKLPHLDLINLVRKDPGAAAAREALKDSLGEAELKKGTAVAFHGPELLVAIESASPPRLFIDDAAQKVLRSGKSNLYIGTRSVAAGTSHAFFWEVDGKRHGGNQNVPAYLPECYAKPQVPQGKLSEKMVHTSAIYAGMQADWWIYVPAQYDGSQPAALMVWQDGQGHIQREGQARTMTVVDNLIHAGKIPVMIQVFVSPGRVGQRAMRSVQYDSVNDTYGRYLRDEILAEVGKRYKIRADAYSRAIAGNSSGGICAFNAAWQMPDQFSRVLSRVGSFTSIQWKPGELDGGNVYPFKVRKEPKRNIRVWLQDGSEDLENSHGSWPLQNIQLANSLKMMGYDFHLSWGNGAHNGAHGNAELPAALAWMWRGYDPGKTSQSYEQEEEEKAKPMFRVRIHNR
jgi:enterochelin esterase family protein